MPRKIEFTLEEKEHILRDKEKLGLRGAARKWEVSPKTVLRIVKEFGGEANEKERQILLGEMYDEIGLLKNSIEIVDTTLAAMRKENNYSEKEVQNLEGLLMLCEEKFKDVLYNHSYISYLSDYSSEKSTYKVETPA